jgi:carbon monoxide dehydrogenase subunit G
MQDINESISVGATPDAVWAIAGDLGNVARWVPAIAASRLEGDIRHATFRVGGDARERIVEVDDAAHSYTYEYVDGPLALNSYTSHFAVSADGAGSAITWTAQLSAASDDEERGLAEAVAGIYAAALVELSRQVTA